MIDSPCTQERFGQIVGISQPAVSDLMARGIIKPNQTAGAWLLAYTSHLREQAAGRGADGELAANRAAESATRNELLQIKLRKAKGEYAEVATIEQVLAFLGSQIASKLEPLPSRIKMLCPQLPAEDIKAIEATITEARNLAASACMATLVAANEFDDGEISEAVAVT